MEVNGAPEGIWPKGQVDGSQPSLARMEELLPCALSEVPDGLFCGAVLEVGVDPTEGELLPFDLGRMANLRTRRQARLELVELKLQVLA